MSIGKLSRDYALQELGLAFLTITGIRKKKKVQHLLLVEPSNILLSPLHITLGLMKNFVKAVDQRGPEFRYFTEKLPGISTAEIVGDRYASSSEMSSLTEFPLVTRRGCGMISGI